MKKKDLKLFKKLSSLIIDKKNIVFFVFVAALNGIAALLEGASFVAIAISFSSLENQQNPEFRRKPDSPFGTCASKHFGPFLFHREEGAFFCRSGMPT